MQECADLLDELNALVEWFELRRSDRIDYDDDWSEDDVRAVF